MRSFKEIYMVQQNMKRKREEREREQQQKDKEVWYKICMLRLNFC